MIHSPKNALSVEVPSIVSNRCACKSGKCCGRPVRPANEPLLALQSVCLTGNRGQGIGDRNRGQERVEKCRFAISMDRR